MKTELIDLAHSLRVRLEEGEDCDWFPPSSKTKAAHAPSPPSSPSPVRDLSALAEDIRACRRCPLGAARLKAVPGVGSARAEVMFIGEGPGFDEDHKGEPFVGKSGQLLDKIMASIGLLRQNVFIANVVKCHPMKDPGSPESRGNDRQPTPEEEEACRPFLDEQIRLIAPKVIMTIGAVPARALLGPGISITRIRGQWKSYKPGGGPATPTDSLMGPRTARLPAGGPAVPLLPTYHPAALLHNPDLKRDVWNDMKSLRDFLKELGGK